MGAHKCVNLFIDLFARWAITPAMNTTHETHTSPQEIRSHWARFLKDKLLKKIQEVPRYSLRAMARDMGVSPAYLSQCFNGKKNISLERAMQLSHILGLSYEEQNGLIDKLKEQMKRAPARKVARASESLAVVTEAVEWQRVLEQWYHLAILDLVTTDNFVPSVPWIAKRLGLTVPEAQEAVVRLEGLGLLKREGRQWSKINRRFHFPTDKSYYWVRSFHKQMIGKAIDELSQKTAESDFEKRDITGTTVAIDPRKIPQAKKMIQRFRTQLAEFLASGETTEVYQLNVQLFSLGQEIGEPLS